MSQFNALALYINCAKKLTEINSTIYLLTNNYFYVEPQKIVANISSIVIVYFQDIIQYLFKRKSYLIFQFRKINSFIVI